MDLVICGLGYMEGLQLLIREVISFLARGLSATLLWARGASIFQKWLTKRSRAHFQIYN